MRISLLAGRRRRYSVCGDEEEGCRRGRDGVNVSNFSTGEEGEGGEGC